MKQPRIILAIAAVSTAAIAMLVTLWILGFERIQSVDHARMMAFNGLPYLALILVGLVSSRRTMSAAIALIGTLVTSCLGVSCLIDAFYLHPDPQSGIVALVLPILQLACCGLTVAAITAMLFLKWLVVPEREKVTAVESGSL